MKTTKVLAMILAAFGLLALAAPAQAQRRGGGHMHGGHHHFHHGHHHNRVGFFFGGFGGPFFWGYPYWGYPYYYGYSYPVAPYYSYDPQGIYQGRLANPPRSTNDGLGKDYSMVKRVQRQLASAGYYHGEIDGIIGSGTRTAIRNYQRDNDLQVDGEIGNELLSSMERG